jgi:LmbE family N-acetylglucosaminyl deacetylase
VGAHHDDLEVSIGGSIRKWADEGHNIFSVILTNSKWTSPDGILCRGDEDILLQNTNAANVLGYTPIHIHEVNALELEFNDKTVARLLKVIAEKKIDMLITIWQHDANPDHQSAARIALAASRKIPRILLTKISWNSVPQVFNPSFFVDISNTLDKKIESIKCYPGEYKRTGDLWEKQIRANADIYGLESNCRYAEAFEIVRYLY